MTSARAHGGRDGGDGGQKADGGTRAGRCAWVRSPSGSWEREERGGGDARAPRGERELSVGEHQRVMGLLFSITMNSRRGTPAPDLILSRHLASSADALHNQPSQISPRAAPYRFTTASPPRPPLSSSLYPSSSSVSALHSLLAIPPPPWASDAHLQTRPRPSASATPSTRSFGCVSSFVHSAALVPTSHMRSASGRSCGGGRERRSKVRNTPAVSTFTTSSPLPRAAGTCCFPGDTRRVQRPAHP